MAAGSENEDEPMASINVVPLVDVILVVLIIFMVTAPLVLKPTIDVNLPKASSGESAPPSKFNVAVASTGIISVNGREASLEQLAAFAKDQAAANPESAAVLEADRTVTLERLTEIIDAIKSSGVKRVAFSVNRK